MSAPPPPGKGPPSAVAEFLARARAMELEAQARYLELADQMEVHNNPEVAALFRRLAEIEGGHARHFEMQAEDDAVPGASSGRWRWPGPEAPETAAADEVHYMMTPYHALALALDAERAAQAFFAGVAETAPDPAVRETARKFAEEEAEHVRLVQSWLERYPAPEPGWDEDPDPPSQPF